MYKLLVLLLSFSFAAFAQDAAKNAAGKSAADPNALFAKKAAQGNMAEVAMGKLAAEKGQSEDVKKFGQRMVDDHTKAEQDLEGVASKNNMTLPSGPSAMQKAEQQKLERLSGATFDRAYMKMMVKDHEEDVAEFRKEANDMALNSDLRDFAKRTYPVLDDHLTNAKAVNDALTSKSATNSAKKNSAGKGESGGPGLLLI
jgi:putative membrane protein